MRTLVFDTCILSPFASAGLLGVLRRVVDGHRCVVVEEVREELRRGLATGTPGLQGALDARWLEPVSLVTLTELGLYASLRERFGSEGRDVGEAATLAWAQANGGTAVTDDRVAYGICQKAGIPCVRTLRLLVNAVTCKTLRIEEAGAVLEGLVA